MASTAQSLLYILESEEFAEFYRKYLLPIVHKPTQGLDGEYDLLQSHVEKIKIPECFIAVLGVQGAGKSSLLNALIFEDEILPVEVEETTCIPTMIRRVYSGEQSGADVHYQNDKVEPIPLKKEFIEKIVDNRYNPGNIMDVAFVVCRVDMPFLREGFVFVDLPGVGSLTEKNEETTMMFLQDAHIGIFLLRTVPPITSSEADFIRIAWPRLQDSIFVQNLWAQETEAEVKEGISHNEVVLRTIAEEQNTSPPSIIVPINVALACQGAYSGDETKINRSRVKELKKYIRMFARRSALENLYRETARMFIRLLEKAQQQITDRIDVLEGSQEELGQQLAQAGEKFVANRERLENHVNKHCEGFLDKIAELKSDWLAEVLDNTSEQCLQKIDRLPIEDLKEDEFRQEVREVFSEVFGNAYKQIKEKLARLAEDHVENLGQSLQRMASISQVLQQSFSANPEQQKGAGGWSVALTGSIAPLVVSGPVGWGILGGAIVTGGLVRWVSGATAHKRIMRGVRKSISDGKRQIRKEIITEIDYFAEQVIEAIKQSVEYELNAYYDELVKLQSDLQQKEGDQEARKAELYEDIKLADFFIERLGRLKESDPESDETEDE